MTWVPEACTLPTVDQPLRVAEFDELFATAVRPAERVGRTELRIFYCRGGDGVDRSGAGGPGDGVLLVLLLRGPAGAWGDGTGGAGAPAHAAVLDGMMDRRAESARSRMRAHRGRP